jgi:hypothetical protein
MLVPVLMPHMMLLLQSGYPDRYGLGLSLLGIVLGPVTVWQAWQSIRNREGDYDAQAYLSSQSGAWIALGVGLAVTAGAAWWLYLWLPEFIFW